MVKVIRPTWSEVMEMDMELAKAVVPGLPNLDDGVAGKLSQLMGALVGSVK